MAKKSKGSETAQPPNMAVEVSRLTKAFSLYLLKDIEEEGRKVSMLRSIGYSVAEIAGMLNKSEDAVQKAIERSKK